MKRAFALGTWLLLLPLIIWPATQKPALPGMAQVPTWSQDDLDFFLHGSMSAEVIPERVLRAFIKAYPDLFPTQDLSHLGLISDPKFGWPIGFSRKGEVKHLGGLSAVGINCASCQRQTDDLTFNNHRSFADPWVAVVISMSEAFFGSVIVATFKTADPANMKGFLSAYLAVTHPKDDPATQLLFAKEWQSQEQKIIAAISSDRLVPKTLRQAISSDRARRFAFRRGTSESACRSRRTFTFDSQSLS